MPNSHESAARLRKAVRLADLLDAAGITAEQAADMDAGDWAKVATAAQVPAPSPTTCALTIQLLRDREDARAMLQSLSQKQGAAVQPVALLTSTKLKLVATQNP